MQEHFPQPPAPPLPADAHAVPLGVSRDEAISRIRAALKARSGKPWSVTGGRGTAWGWITVTAPPARRTMRSRLKDGALNNWPENWENYDSGQPGGFITDDDRAELQRLFGLDSIPFLKIPASPAHYREHIDRAEGRTPSAIAERYWD